MPAGAHIPPVVPVFPVTFILKVYQTVVLAQMLVFKAFISPMMRRVCSDSKVSQRIGTLTLQKHLAGTQARPCHLARECCIVGRKLSQVQFASDSGFLFQMKNGSAVAKRGPVLIASSVHESLCFIIHHQSFRKKNHSVVCLPL